MSALRAVVLVAFATALALAPPAAAGAGAHAAGDPMVERINDLRARNGLPALRQAPRLMRSSKGYARRLMRTDSFGHGSSYRAAGFRTSGEMLALRNGWKLARSTVVRMWGGSPAHRALMLSRSFRHIGVGAVRGRFAGRPSTIWVVHLGAP